MPKDLCYFDFDLCHWLNIFRKKKRFQKKARSKKFCNFSGTASTAFQNKIKLKEYLLSRNLKKHYPKKELIPYKYLTFWKMYPKLFDICENWTNRDK